MDIQPIFNGYKAVTYMRSYFSKYEDQCSVSIRQAAKETFENNESLHDTMKIIVKRIILKENVLFKSAVESFQECILLIRL